MKKLLLSIAFLLPGMGMMAQTQVKTAGGVLEGKGISPALAKKVNHRLLIPNFPEGRATADSLNVAIATAITCSEFRRTKSL